MLWGYKMGFGSPIGGGSPNIYNYKYTGNFFANFFNNFVGHPESINAGHAQIGQAALPIGTSVPLQMPTPALAYFQFVFAAITPLLFLGSVLGRIKVRVWMIFVPAWCTFVYTVNAMLIWGGGYWAHEGALDYSGGYVIHLAAGTSGFVAAWVIGPRLARDRARFVPHSLTMVAVGAGILWLGWNGFNGGDPYFSGADAATAVINTNVATAVALLTWVGWDMFLSKAKKPTFLGAVNGMIVGLVAITPCAGYVSGSGAIWVGLIASTIVWFAWTYLMPITMRRVDDAMGVVYTHGVAGLVRRPARRYLRRPGRHHLRQRQRVTGRGEGLAVRQPPPVLHPVVRGADDHRLRRPRHVHHPEGHQHLHAAANARRGARDRRPRRPRRGGLPGRRGLHPGRPIQWRRGPGRRRPTPLDFRRSDHPGSR